MDSRLQAEQILKKIKSCSPTKTFKPLDHSESGLCFILIYLDEAEREVYASEISEKMKISRAGVAKLIKKLIYKEFVTKRVSHTDARKEIINITEKGRIEACKHREEVMTFIENLIRKVGVEKIEKFIDLAEEIKNSIDQWIENAYELHILKNKMTLQLLEWKNREIMEHL